MCPVPAGAPAAAPVFAIGCSGVITHWEMTPDGRYNIILRGVDRFRIVEENDERQYRRAAIEQVAVPVLSRDERIGNACSICRV